MRNFAVLWEVGGWHFHDVERPGDGEMSAATGTEFGEHGDIRTDPAEDGDITPRVDRRIGSDRFRLVVRLPSVSGGFPAALLGA